MSLRFLRTGAAGLAITARLEPGEEVAGVLLSDVVGRKRVGLPEGCRRVDRTHLPGPLRFPEQPPGRPPERVEEVSMALGSEAGADVRIVQHVEHLDVARVGEPDLAVRKVDFACSGRELGMSQVLEERRRELGDDVGDLVAVPRLRRDDDGRFPARLAPRDRPGRRLAAHPNEGEHQDVLASRDG
jgi:hypothetical protein